MTRLAALADQWEQEARDARATLTNYRRPEYRTRITTFAEVLDLCAAELRDTLGQGDKATDEALARFLSVHMPTGPTVEKTIKRPVNAGTELDGLDG